VLKPGLSLEFLFAGWGDLISRIEKINFWFGGNGICPVSI
jgi:hypothetical protein